MDTNLKRKSIPQRTRFAILKRDNFRCQYCGKTSEQTQLEVDHIIPVAKGGADDEGNLITSCKICNRGKLVDDVIPNTVCTTNEDIDKRIAEIIESEKQKALSTRQEPGCYERLITEKIYIPKIVRISGDKTTEYVNMVCNSCGYRYEYTGQAEDYTECPKCHAPIKIPKTHLTTIHYAKSPKCIVGLL